MGSSNLNFLLFQWEVVIHLDHHHNMCIADCYYLFILFNSPHWELGMPIEKHCQFTSCDSDNIKLHEKVEVSANRRKIYTMKNVMMYNIIRMIMSNYVLHICDPA